MANKFHACPKCRKVHQFKVTKCSCGYGEEEAPAPSPEVEAAAAELLKPDPVLSDEIPEWLK